MATRQWFLWELAGNEALLYNQRNCSIRLKTPVKFAPFVSEAFQGPKDINTI